MQRLLLASALAGFGAAGLSAAATLQDAAPLTPAPATTVAALPKGNFLENVALGPDGAFYITSYVGREILRYSPTDGISRFTGLDFNPVGIAFEPDGSAILSGHHTNILSGIPPRNNAVYRLDRKGKASLILELPDAVFLNGVLQLRPGLYAIADAGRGLVLKVDVARKTASVWLDDPKLKPIGNDPIAVNGLKLFAGYLYLSNSSQHLLLRARYGGPDNVGPLEVVHADLPIDDFAFAADGTLYSTTHRQFIYRTGTDGRRVAIAGPNQGVLGSTAVIFGVTRDDCRSLYAVGDGGLFQGGPLRTANVVRLDVNQTAVGGCPSR